MNEITEDASYLPFAGCISSCDSIPTAPGQGEASSRYVAVALNNGRATRDPSKRETPFGIWLLPSMAELLLRAASSRSRGEWDMGEGSAPTLRRLVEIVDRFMELSGQQRVLSSSLSKVEPLTEEERWQTPRRRMVRVVDERRGRAAGLTKMASSTTVLVFKWAHENTENWIYASDKQYSQTIDGIVMFK